MKKQILSIALLLCSAFTVLNVTAQESNITKGSWIVEGMLGFGGKATFNSGVTKINGEKLQGNKTSQNNFSLNITPAFYYMITDRVGIGASLGYLGTFSSSKKKLANADGTGMTDDFESSKHAMNMCYIAPKVRGYIASVGKLSFFLDGTVGIGIGGAPSWKIKGQIGGDTFEESSKDNKDPETKTTTLMVDFNIKPGISYFITDQLAIVGTFGKIGGEYWSTSMKNNDNKFSSPGPFHFVLGLDINVGINFKF